jgi:hypothetical protein
MESSAPYSLPPISFLLVELFNRSVERPTVAFGTKRTEYSLKLHSELVVVLEQIFFKLVPCFCDRKLIANISRKQLHEERGRCERWVVDH